VQEKKKTLKEAEDIAKALEPLGYEVYGIEDTGYTGQPSGLVVKVIRASAPQRSIAKGKFKESFKARQSRLGNPQTR
jgi:hypothetical protein